MTPEQRAAALRLADDDWIEPLRIAGLTLIGLAEHDQHCGVFDLDDDGKHCACTCGLDGAIATITQAGRIAAEPAQEPQAVGINYFAVQQFAADHRLDYNETCAALRDFLAAREAEPQAEPVKDLRMAKWLDPKCADAGACQSLVFKSAHTNDEGPSNAAHWHKRATEAEARCEMLEMKLEAARRELAKVNNEFGSENADWPEAWRRVAEVKERAGRLWRDNEMLRAALAELTAVCDQIVDAGHMNTEDLARLRAALGRPE